MNFFLVFGTILGLYVAVNGYLLARAFSMLAGTGVLRGGVSALILFFAAAFPLGRILSARVPVQITDVLTTIGSLYFAPMIYAFFLTMAMDILRVFNKHFVLTPLPPPFTVSGRIHAVFFVAFASLAISFLGALNAKFPTVVRHQVEWTRQADDDPSSPQTYKIAIVSDIHLGRLVSNRHLRKLTEIVNRENPDLVLLPGDTVDDTAWLFDRDKRSQAQELFRSLKPRLGVWAITGNHEYYAGIDEIAPFWREVGISLLRDEGVVLDGELLLIGREDRTIIQTGGNRRTIAEILYEAGQTPGEAGALPVVLMDHQPFHLEEAADAGIALQLSGHTHRGQLFPFNFLVTALYECHYGLYKKGRTHYYISSGAGTWGPPIRTSGRPEIAMISLRVQ